MSVLGQDETGLPSPPGSSGNKLAIIFRRVLFEPKDQMKAGSSSSTTLASVVFKTSDRQSGSPPLKKRGTIIVTDHFEVE